MTIRKISLVLFKIFKIYLDLKDYKYEKKIGINKLTLKIY